MVAFLNRFPNQQQVVHTFVIVVFFVHLWAILRMLRDLTAVSFYLTGGSLAGYIAYILVVALCESLLLSLLLLLSAALLPAKVLKNHLLAQSSLILLFLYQIMGFFRLPFVRFGSMTVFAAVLVCLWLGVIFFSSLFTPLFERWRPKAGTLMGRLVVLAAIYLALDITSLCIVIIRNL